MQQELSTVRPSTPGLWYRNMWCCQLEEEQLLKPMKDERNAIAMKVSKCAGRRKPRG